MPKAAAKPAPKDDPFDLHRRTEQVYDWLLTDWESDPKLKNRNDAIKILQYGGMFLTRNIKLKDASDESHAGSAVAKYSGAFQVKTPHGVSRGKADARPARPALAYSDTDDDDPDAAA